MTFKEHFKVDAHELVWPERLHLLQPKAHQDALAALDPWDIVLFDRNRTFELVPMTHLPQDEWIKGTYTAQRVLALFRPNDPDRSCRQDRVIVPIGREFPFDVSNPYRIVPHWFNPFKLQIEPAELACRAPGYAGWAYHTGSGYNRGALIETTVDRFPKYQQTNAPFRTFFAVGIVIESKIIAQSALAKEKPWLK